MPTRKLIVDQDMLGPATSNIQSVVMLLNAPDVDVLGICVPTGDSWRDIQVRHALRMLEILGRPEVPVVPGALMPLVNNPRELELWEKRYGKLIYKGAWDHARPNKHVDPFAAPDLVEGNPTLKPSSEEAANFIVRMARSHPGEISLWCAAPMTDVALALRLELQEINRLAREARRAMGARLKTLPARLAGRLGTTASAAPAQR